jgi:L-asparaginase
LTVKLITTGGTIATVSSRGRTKAALGGAAIAELVTDVDVEVEELALAPSWTLTPGEMLRIALAARDAGRSGRYSGVVVTHGTSTLEYTAFLAELFNDTPAPIVFTGAMRLASDPEPDGPRNLADAVRVATTEQSRGFRSLVAFAGLVMTARHAWKMKRDRVDAFVSTNGHGTVSAGRVSLPPRPGYAPVLDGVLEQDVALLKVYPAIRPEMLAAAMAEPIRGLVLEALPGAGGIPREIHEPLRAAAARLAIAVASRAPVGHVPSPPTGGTGEPLSSMQLISAHDLTSEKAWLLMMAVLGQSRTRAEARELFLAHAIA